MSLKERYYNGLLISKEALELIEGKGYTGNGCGSGIFSQMLCFVATMFLKVDLSDVWLVHDAEYDLSRTIKSSSRKAEADLNAELNLKAKFGLSGEPTGDKKYLHMFSNAVHALLVLGGDYAYWDLKGSAPFRKWATLGAIIAITGIFFITR